MSSSPRPKKAPLPPPGAKFARLELPEVLPDGVSRDEAEGWLRALKEERGALFIQAKARLVESGIYEEEVLFGEKAPDPLTVIPFDPAPAALPPVDHQAEMVGIAGYLAHAPAHPEVAEWFGPDDLHGPAQRRALRAIEAILEEGKPPSPVLIRLRLSEDPAAIACGALPAFDEVERINPPDLEVLREVAAHLRGLGDARREQAARRKLSGLALDPGLKNGRLQEEAGKILEDLAGYHVREGRDADAALRGWPAPAGEAALHGVAGDFIRTVAPLSVADPMAVLGQFLVAFSSMCGHNPCWFYEETRHALNEFLVVVGPSSTGAKGTAWKIARNVLRGCDHRRPEWAPRTGLISGEGLIDAVRDPSDPRQGRLRGVDDGVDDKRALFVETEFSSVLAARSRKGNSLTEQLRKVWDGDPVAIATRNLPLSSDRGHVSLIGHVTPGELLELFGGRDRTNGLANRILWCCSIQSGSQVDSSALRRVNWEANGIRPRIRAAIEYAQADSDHAEGLVLARDAEAERIWDEAYAALDEPGPGVLGVMRARAKPHAMRLAATYAILDCSALIRAEHLRAGLAFWDYCSRSLSFIFGGGEGKSEGLSALEERAYREVLACGAEGMAQEMVTRKIFRGQSRAAYPVLNRLIRDGLIRVSRVETNKRTRTIFIATRARK